MKFRVGDIVQWTAAERQDRAELGLTQVTTGIIQSIAVGGDPRLSWAVVLWAYPNQTQYTYQLNAWLYQLELSALSLVEGLA